MGYSIVEKPLAIQETAGQVRNEGLEGLFYHSLIAGTDPRSMGYSIVKKPLITQETADQVRSEGSGWLFYLKPHRE